MSRQRVVSGVCRFCRYTHSCGKQKSDWIDEARTVCFDCQDLNNTPAPRTLISRLSEDQLDQLAYHRERGVSVVAIAKRYGLTVGNLRWHFLVSGVAPNRAGTPLRPIPETPIVEVFVRHGRQVEIRRYTVSEDVLLLELESQGLKYGQIARRLGRSRNSVIGRLATLARRSTRIEEAEASTIFIER